MAVQAWKSTHPVLSDKVTFSYMFLNFSKYILYNTEKHNL